ncbi:MAG: hypothetical protein EA362_01935 [Saprospirales bacterium]|nr:MAG: hypothetical protein EA362_01935 [Saprospirales bacterium]
MFRFVIVFLISFLVSIQLEGQIVHNFFGKDLMTIRENNHWIVSNAIEEIYELIIDKENANAELRRYTFDHNGLPILILTGIVDTSWAYSDQFSAEVEYSFIYVMEELFLRRKVNQRSFQGLINRENIFSETKYVNYFNRPQFKDGKGLELNFYFTPGGRPLEISIQNSNSQEIHFHLSYQSNRVDEVTKLEKQEDGQLSEVMRAIYEYDRNNRPERIVLWRDEKELITIGIEYDHRAFPIRKSFFREGQLYKEVRYFFTVN